MVFGKAIGQQPSASSDAGFKLPAPMQAALDAFGAAINGGRDNAVRALQGLASRLPRAERGRAAPAPFSMRADGRTADGGPATLAAPLASISSSAWSPRTPQPLYDLALAPSAIAPKLQHVAVWTVTNSALEFITVSGKEAQRQMQLFFFKEADAMLLLEKIRAKDPALGKSARIAEVGLDKVYAMMTSIEAKGTGADDVAFRFVPDAAEVAAAMELSRSKGTTMDSFPGVPVFQAVGLTMRNKTTRYLPLFLCKEDADHAIAVAKAKGAEMGAGTDAARTPTLEVGSLEAVLLTMQEDDETKDGKDGKDGKGGKDKATGKGHWSEMVLIASSKSAADAAATPAQAATQGTKPAEAKK